MPVRTVVVHVGGPNGLIVRISLSFLHLIPLSLTRQAPHSTQSHKIVEGTCATIHAAIPRKDIAFLSHRRVNRGLSEALLVGIGALPNNNKARFNEGYK